MALKDHQVTAYKDEAEKRQERRERRSPHQGIDGCDYINSFFVNLRSSVILSYLLIHKI